GFRQPPFSLVYWSSVLNEAREVMAKESVMVLSIDHGHGWPAIAYTEAEWTGRGPSLWPFLAEESSHHLAVEWAKESLDNRPAVLVPNERLPDALWRLESDSAFMAVWRGYTPADSMHYFRLY